MAKQTLEQLLEKVDKQVKAKIEKILANLTPEQRLAIIDNPAIIDDLLKDIDVQQLAKYYMTELTGIAGIVIKDYSFEIAEAQKQKVNIFVNKLLELKTDTLRQFIESNKAQFKNKIIELIINGSNRKVIKEYFAKTPFTNAQIGTLINTAESDIRRTTVLSAYEDREGMRFRYEGGLIPTSSDNCTWLIENQKEEGYLLKEIQTGITTPYGTIDWGGRVPNYNCIHHFEAILEIKKIDDKNVYHKITKFEESIKDSTIEKCGAFDKNGNLVLSKDGLKTEIGFTEEEVSLLKDTIFTHNHPSGRTFSIEDIRMLSKGDLNEMRVIGSNNNWYSMKIKEGAIFDEDKLVRVFNTSHENLLNEIKPQLFKEIPEKYYNDFFELDKTFQKKLDMMGTVTMGYDEANMIHYHIIWKNISKELNLVYTYGRY